MSPWRGDREWARRLITDQPTARLDSGTTIAIGGLLGDLCPRDGTTVVCATHDPLLIALAGAEVPLERTPVRSG